MVDAGIPVLDIYKGMTSYNPFWLRAAFKIRDFFCVALGLQPISGFSLRKKGNISVGDKLDFFYVEKISANELILSSNDKHLVVFVHLLLNPISGKVNKISIETSVYVHNMLGVIYMIPVRFVHWIIVKKMLKRAAKITS